VRGGGSGGFSKPSRRSKRRSKQRGGPRRPVNPVSKNKSGTRKGVLRGCRITGAVEENFHACKKGACVNGSRVKLR